MEISAEGKTIDEVTQTLKIGDKKHRDVQEDNIFDRRFRELKELITSKIDQQFDETRKAREMLMDKFSKIDLKVNSMLEFQNTVKILRKELITAENTLAELHDRVEKLDIFSESSISTLLYLPGAGIRDTIDLIQQKCDLAPLPNRDYYQKCDLAPLPNREYYQKCDLAPLPNRDYYEKCDLAPLPSRDYYQTTS